MRAIHLSQYLSSGESETPEYMLALNKLLCGWPVEATVTRGIEITEREIAESQTLSSAVIRHWSALKNTSVEGLRVAFLRREGVLAWQDDHWTLQVENKAHDLLLDRLPWGLAMIKLSWMTTLVYVEWQPHS